MFWAICGFYALTGTGFLGWFIRDHRRERRHQAIEIDTGIRRLEQYANTGESHL